MLAGGLDLIKVNVLFGHFGNGCSSVEPAVCSVSLKLCRAVKESKVEARGHKREVKQIVIGVIVSYTVEINYVQRRGLIYDVRVLADQISPFVGKLVADVEMFCDLVNEIFE